MPFLLLRLCIEEGAVIHPPYAASVFLSIERADVGAVPVVAQEIAAEAKPSSRDDESAPAASGPVDVAPKIGKRSHARQSMSSRMRKTGSMLDECVVPAVYRPDS